MKSSTLLHQTTPCFVTQWLTPCDHARGAGSVFVFVLKSTDIIQYLEVQNWPSCCGSLYLSVIRFYASTVRLSNTLVSSVKFSCECIVGLFSGFTSA